MEPLASPIHIDIVPSKTLNRVVLGAHLFTIAVLVPMFPLHPGTLFIVACVCLSLYIQIRGRRDLSVRVAAILLGADDTWSSISPAGEITGAQLLQGTFVTTWLVVITLKPRGQRAVRIVLTRDNTEADTFRRLRVRLLIPRH